MTPGPRDILHVDMDAFYASVEQRDDPSLRGRPVVVGGRSRRGVVAAASYEARTFGVRSAMPIMEALRRCPHAVVVPPRIGHYAKVSDQVFAVFRRYTPLVEGLSLDEAFLDVTASRALYGDGPAIARRIKDEVRAETELVASAGVAPCKFVAKIASDHGKPDGLCVVAAADVVAFLDPLPVGRMWGIGQKTLPRLERVGLRTIGDLARADPAHLEALLGAWGREVHLLARGLDARAVDPDGEAQSVGAEETFEHDLTDRGALRKRLLAQSVRVAERLGTQGVCGRTVTVKLKYADFTVRTRRTTLPEPCSDTDTIYEAACALLERFELPGRGVRLTGVSVGDLISGPPPPTLLPDPARERRQKLEAATAAVKARFGGKSLVRGALLEPDDEGE